ncbi:unnamed protein product [Amoebophrya sp. A25]|nr:unnamed protein product [Amoebophrya sp. A25]|eukprot:GSA25T00017149001.1
MKESFSTCLFSCLLAVVWLVSGAYAASSSSGAVYYTTNPEGPPRTEQISIGSFAAPPSGAPSSTGRCSSRGLDLYDTFLDFFEGGSDPSMVAHLISFSIDQGLRSTDSIIALFHSLERVADRLPLMGIHAGGISPSARSLAASLASSGIGGGESFLSSIGGGARSVVGGAGGGSASFISAPGDGPVPGGAGLDMGFGTQQQQHASSSSTHSFTSSLEGGGPAGNGTGASRTTTTQFNQLQISTGTTATPASVRDRSASGSSSYLLGDRGSGVNMMIPSPMPSTVGPTVPEASQPFLATQTSGSMMEPMSPEEIQELQAYQQNPVDPVSGSVVERVNDTQAMVQQHQAFYDPQRSTAGVLIPCAPPPTISQLEPTSANASVVGAGQHQQEDARGVAGLVLPIASRGEAGGGQFQQQHGASSGAPHNGAVETSQQDAGDPVSTTNLSDRVNYTPITDRAFRSSWPRCQLQPPEPLTTHMHYDVDLLADEGGIVGQGQGGIVGQGHGGTTTGTGNGGTGSGTGSGTGATASRASESRSSSMIANTGSGSGLPSVSVPVDSQCLSGSPDGTVGGILCPSSDAVPLPRADATSFSSFSGGREDVPSTTGRRSQATQSTTRTKRCGGSRRAERRDAARRQTEYTSFEDPPVIGPAEERLAHERGFTQKLSKCSQQMKLAKQQQQQAEQERQSPPHYNIATPSDGPSTFTTPRQPIITSGDAAQPCLDASRPRREETRCCTGSFVSRPTGQQQRAQPGTLVGSQTTTAARSPPSSTSCSHHSTSKNLVNNWHRVEVDLFQPAMGRRWGRITVQRRDDRCRDGATRTSRRGRSSSCGRGESSNAASGSGRQRPLPFQRGLCCLKKLFKRRSRGGCGDDEDGPGGGNVLRVSQVLVQIGESEQDAVLWKLGAENDCLVAKEDSYFMVVNEREPNEIL